MTERYARFFAAADAAARALAGAHARPPLSAPAIVPPRALFPPLGPTTFEQLPALTITPSRVYAEPINVDELAMLDAVTTSALVREVERKLRAEDARLRRILPPPPAGHEWRPEISTSTDHGVDAFATHETIRLRYRLVEIVTE